LVLFYGGKEYEMKKRKKLSKQEINELKDSYRKVCKLRYYGILFAYFVDFSLKIYLCYMVAGVWLAYTGAAIDFGAKWYMLKNMKMRKNGYYRR
jgi:hypothetical protein